jgi:hypothetical protein
MRHVCECTAMDAMCKPGLVTTRIRPACGRALHSRHPLSTASSAPPVQIVGNAGPNSGLFTGLPAFHFGSVQFSKTGRVAIHAARLVFSLLSTFPVSTVTTTKREYIFKAFHSSRAFSLPPESVGVGELHFLAVGRDRTISRVVRSALQIPASRCFYFRPGIHRKNALNILMRLRGGVE